MDVIYAAVRYPDEVVDTFPIPAAEKSRVLEEWRKSYEQALSMGDFRLAIQNDVSPWVAGFAEVALRNQIPAEYYHAFLDAMASDIQPKVWRDLPDLIDGYIYGSAIVVGYFLAYVYGPSEPAAWPRAMEASRNLGIALQLTNFLRDTGEDERRGRVYLAPHLLRRDISLTAEAHYREAEANLDAFASDCRVAIRACIDVYRKLNAQTGLRPEGECRRESMPAIEKFRALPASKFWRLPLAYLGAL